MIPEYEKILKEVNYVHHQLVAIYFTDGTYDVCMFDGGSRLFEMDFHFDDSLVVILFHLALKVLVIMVSSCWVFRSGLSSVNCLCSGILRF